LAKAFHLPDLRKAGYILDIDLDDFHTRKSIKPQDASVFHNLICRATAVTFATEADFVAQEWLDPDIDCC
jgi:hypothetical protein